MDDAVAPPLPLYMQHLKEQYLLHLERKQRNNGPSSEDEPEQQVSEHYYPDSASGAPMPGATSGAINERSGDAPEIVLGLAPVQLTCPSCVRSRAATRLTHTRHDEAASPDHPPL